MEKGEHLAELERFKPLDLDFDRKEKVITLRVGKFAQGDTEFVERIPDSLWRWLPKTKSGPIAPPRVRLRLRAFRAALGYTLKNPWPKDVARHTFASHFAAKAGSLDAVAFALNHRGPSTTLKYYRKRVPQAAGEAYFSILPRRK
jgi:integrase